MKLTEAEKDHLFIHIGTAYNNHRLSDKYGSTNGFIDEIIRIIEQLIDNQAFQLYVNCINEEVKRLENKNDQ